jgi:hypothetical protein
LWELGNHAQGQWRRLDIWRVIVAWNEIA